MAYFLGQNVVNYVCGCGILKPITKIYFCRHCLKIRCGFCVYHEVDSYYCVNCLENIPSSEARLRKHKCGNCFNCPCCFHTLATRATNVALPVKADDERKDAKPITRKMYYFACFSCRWTSRDVGIPDQTVASGAWPDRENVHSNRIVALQEYFTTLVIKDKIAKQEMLKKKHNARSKFTTLTDKTGLTAAIIRKQVGLPSDISIPSSAFHSSNKPTIVPAVASEDVDDLPDDIFTTPLNLMEVTTVEQRLFQPDNQAASVTGLFPQHKLLSIKQSLRCRQCEHNVIKPEYNPSSIKFKINLLACYHVPELRLISCEVLKPGQSSKIILKLTNPTHNEMLISFLSVDFECPEPGTKSDKKSGAEESSLILGRQLSVSIPEEPREFKNISNSTIDLPQESITLPARDDSAEYDDDAVIERGDDPGFIIWRKHNKLSLKFFTTPNADLKSGDEVIIGLTLKYTYVNTVFPEKMKHELFAKVFVTAGKIQ
ncbi:dynactin subunit 4-like [Ctenocephalides felis]|uniref:dynactin subunit 4-like n=1 Tax=Ctenocephalides felis TaxID=7515 RepID=UPI000E6E4061|nr:dynactin subunit 4-like [Ctenocephalides felis]